MNLSLAWLSLIHSQNHPHTQMVQHSIILVLTAIDGAIVYTTYYVRLRYITRNITIEDSVSLWTNVSIVDIIRAICGQLIYANVFIHSFTHSLCLGFFARILFWFSFWVDVVVREKGSYGYGKQSEGFDSIWRKVRNGRKNWKATLPIESSKHFAISFVERKHGSVILRRCLSLHYIWSQWEAMCVCVGRW